MEDNQILALYRARDEQAIAQTEAKYGRYCHAIAYNILENREDAQECVNDTYAAAWNRIPPHNPAVLSTFLGKLTRRISLTRWRHAHRQKRGGGQVPLAMEELSECLSGSQDVARELELKELRDAINRFLSMLPDTERDVFVCRYWHLAPVAQISRAFGFTESKTKSMLFRTRGKLRTHLQKEGLL